MKRLLSVFATVICFWSTDASGQACCSGSAANEFGVVARGNRALLGARLGQQYLPWTVDQNARAAPVRNSLVLDTALTLGGGIRLISPSFQLQGMLPLRVQHRTFGELAQTSTGLGDAGLYARWMVVEDDTEGIFESGSWVPFVEPFVGALFPTGRGPSSSSAVTGADVTGTGDFRLVVGVRLSRFVTERDVVFVSGAWIHPFAREVETTSATERLRAGETFSSHLSYFRYVSLFWAFGVSVDYLGSLDARAEGAAIPGSDTRRLTLGVQASYFFSWPSWQVRASLSADPPLDGLGKNLPFSGVGAALSLERHFGFADGS